MSTVKLKGGTTIVIDGHPATLSGDTDVDCASEHFEALREHSTVPFLEYPKVVNGQTFANAKEEADWRTPPQPLTLVDPETDERPDPLDDVEIEMDNPEFNPPKRSKRK